MDKLFGTLIAMEIIWYTYCYGYHLVHLLLWTSFGALIAMDIIWCT